MGLKRKIRVLIIDDSILFREAARFELEKDGAIEVIGTAGDPFDARDKIIELNPDLLTLDVEMPKMNGIDFLKKLMPQFPLPVVVVSSASNSVFEAMSAGAVDFVAKPLASNSSSLQSFFNELTIKIKIASTAKVGSKNNIIKNNVKESVKRFKTGSVIAIGASTGGPEALSTVLGGLVPNMPPIVIVQHMPANFTKMFAERLDRISSLSVKEAEDGDILQTGKVLLAPGDRQMEVKKRGAQYYVKVYEGDKVSGHCPSVDVLFNSVAQTVGSKGFGVIMTGMGYDGAKGLLEMKKKGSFTIGQDKQSCIVYGMPQVAFNIGAVSEQIPLDKIASKIIENLNKN